MKIKHIALTILIVIITATILPGCSIAQATSTPPPAVLPTVDQQPTFNFIKTQAVESVIADLTLNAPIVTPIVPTDTAVPTETPFPTETWVPSNTPLPPTATYIPWTLAPLKSATPIGFSCSILEVSPTSSVSLKTGADFDGRWVVKNTGTLTWADQDVDIKYISGTKFQTSGDLFDLSSSVAQNSSYTMIIDMKAPGDAGTYKTSWAIMRGSLTICTLKLTVVVVK
jgi:hypothetical protein